MCLEPATVLSKYMICSNAVSTLRTLGLFANVCIYLFRAIWKVFMDLDSSRYPMQSFGDPFFRMYGKYMRHFINVAQSLQQFMTVAILILSKTNNIVQISKNSICFSGCMVLVMGIGMISGIIRSLKKIDWLSNASVWMNIANFVIM